MSFSQKLLDLRKKHGLSQEQLAAKLGVSRQTISKWELGTAVPDTVNIMELSKLFGVTTDYLLLDKEEPPQKAVTSGPRFLSKAEQLLHEKGYMIGYYLMWKELLAIIGVVIIALVYLEAVSIIGVPLRDLPIQAFMLPIIAGCLAVFCLIRLVLLLILTIKFKNLDRK